MPIVFFSQGVRSLSGGLPLWAQGQVDKTWRSIATGGIDVVNPLIGGLGSTQATVLSAWSGGCAWGSFYGIHGGGHGDGQDDSLYLLDISQDTPIWTRPWGPTASFAGGTEASNSAANYANGDPRSTHSQYRLILTAGNFWIAGIDNMTTGGLDSSAVFKLARSGFTWTALGPLLLDAEFSVISWHGGLSLYDRVSGYNWMLAQATDLDTKVVAVLINESTNATRKIKGYLPTGYQAGVIAHDLRKLLIAEGIAGDLIVYDITSLPNDGDTITRTICTVSGTSSPDWRPGAGAAKGAIAYHQASRAMLAWNNHAANLVKVAIPADPMAGTYTVTTVSPDASNAVTPSTGQTNGTQSRGQIVGTAGREWFVVCNDYNGPTYAYLLPLAGV